jgi:hypothetical protein
MDEKTPLQSAAVIEAQPKRQRQALLLPLLVTALLLYCLTDLGSDLVRRPHRRPQIPIHRPHGSRSLGLQAKNLTQTRLSQRRAKEVKAVFREAYHVYAKHAFGRDSVNPVSGTSLDDRNGWGATIVDSLSTMLIMGLDDLYKQGVKHVAHVDFTRSDTSVSVFETTVGSSLPRDIGLRLRRFAISEDSYRRTSLAGRRTRSCSVRPSHLRIT